MRVFHFNRCVCVFVFNRCAILCLIDAWPLVALHPEHQFLHPANAARPTDVMAGKGVPSSRGGSSGAEAPRKAPSAGRAGAGSSCCTGRRGPACRSGHQGEPGAYHLDVRPPGLPPRPRVPPLPRGTALTLVHFHPRPPICAGNGAATPHQLTMPSLHTTL